MRAVIPTDLLLRLMNATPEQYAAVERVLGCAGDRRLELGDRTNRTDETDEEWESENVQRPTSNVQCSTSVNEEVARSAFALLVRLDVEGKFKSPAPLRVFRLYCVEGYSAEQVARKCRCAKGTVMSRLRFIETVTKTKPEQFRAMAGHLQQVDEELNASGAREIYRRGLANEGDD
jgi:hypothetical protein